MAAELSGELGEETELIQSSGGVFEVEDRGRLLFSKKSLGRFPANGELLGVINGVESGASLDEAKTKAAEGVPAPISFIAWLQGFLKRRNVKGS